MLAWYFRLNLSARFSVTMMPIVLLTIVADLVWPSLVPLVIVASAVAVGPTFFDAVRSLREWRISIDAFNAFAFSVAVGVGESRSAAFIALMLLSARVLESLTEAKMRRAVEALLKLKPVQATVETTDGVREVAVAEVKSGDLVLVRAGQRVAVDGTVVAGEGFVNEAAVTGESVPEAKSVGDEVMSLTLCESGFLKLRATRVGRDSTAERMVELMREAAKRKSRAEKLADQFAGWFLPGVLLLGAGTLFVTHNWSMVAALFLVACADDMAVAIPLAVTAAMRRAAKLGVVIKSGRWLDALADVKTFVFDKTGTLTYGSLQVSDIDLVSDVQPEDFWCALAVAEKYSDHPVGRAVFREAARRCGAAPDATDFSVIKGAGVRADWNGRQVIAGNERVLELVPAAARSVATATLERQRQTAGLAAFVVFIDGVFVGSVAVSDVVRAESAESLRRLRDGGSRRVVMFTGDDAATAERIGRELGVDEIRAAMSPEDKLRAVEALRADGRVVMIGDGINDAPALAVADVGIAMGAGGTAIAVEAADLVIMTDRLDRLPEVVELAKLTRRVVRVDAGIWAASNIVGFALVLTGLIGPAAAALYNLLSDLLPLANSTLFFREKRPRGQGGKVEATPDGGKSPA